MAHDFLHAYLSEEDISCCVCFYDSDAFTECGHWLCRRCTLSLKKRSCPVCRRSLPDSHILSAASTAIEPTRIIELALKSGDVKALGRAYRLLRQRQGGGSHHPVPAASMVPTSNGQQPTPSSSSSSPPKATTPAVPPTTTTTTTATSTLQATTPTPTAPATATATATAPLLAAFQEQFSKAKSLEDLRTLLLYAPLVEPSVARALQDHLEKVNRRTLGPQGLLLLCQGARSLMGISTLADNILGRVLSEVALRIISSASPAELREGSSALAEVWRLQSEIVSCSHNGSSASSSSSNSSSAPSFSSSSSLTPGSELATGLLSNGLQSVLVKSLDPKNFGFDGAKELLLCLKALRTFGVLDESREGYLVQLFGLRVGSLLSTAALVDLDRFEFEILPLVPSVAAWEATKDSLAQQLDQRTKALHKDATSPSASPLEARRKQRLEVRLNRIDSFAKELASIDWKSSAPWFASLNGGPDSHHRSICESSGNALPRGDPIWSGRPGNQLVPAFRGSATTGARAVHWSPSALKGQQPQRQRHFERNEHTKLPAASALASSLERFDVGTRQLAIPTNHAMLLRSSSASATRTMARAAVTTPSK